MPEYWDTIDAAQQPVGGPDMWAMGGAPQGEAGPSLWSKLAQTWPARMVQDAYALSQYPGQVHRGEVAPLSQQMLERDWRNYSDTPPTGGTPRIEPGLADLFGMGGVLPRSTADTVPMVDRSADLAGLIMSGTFAGAPAGAFGAGPVRKLPPTDPAALGLHETTTPGRILNKTAERGGYSVNLPSGEIPTEGFMMGKFKNEDPRNLVVDQLRRGDIAEHAETNKNVLASPENYLGTWRDPETGKVYLDVSQRFAPDEIRKATKYGERTGQIAGYDVAAGKSIPVGNWDEFVKSPEFAARMDEMAGVGRDYLKKFPAKEWWDLPGTAFERVYGEGNLPQVAGFTATTAPNTKPIENLQTMSEYMRRHIKGEPTVQPDWRVPEGTMSRQAGTQIGMEAGRANNLRKSAEGRLDLLQKDKVREEAAAMMGDRNAVVLDRHWARIGEAPERGIFANVEEGVVKDKAYQTMKQQVVDQARKVGRDPRDYSADVWTGIRETIQKTSQLYGTKYKGSAITGESKSYADHFEDLLRRKAEHLKISQPELEKRLRMGDAELLSVMLATPAIYSMYQMQGANRGQ